MAGNPLDPNTPLNGSAPAQTQARLAGNPLDPNHPLSAPAPAQSNPVIYSGRIGAPGTITPPGTAQSAAALKRVSTATNKALNYQLVHGPLKVITGKSTYEEQLPVYRQKLGLQGLYDWHEPNLNTGIAAIDRPVNAVQDFAHSLANNFIDAAITMPIDPLTWESLGSSVLGKTPVGIAARTLAAKTLNKTIAGRAAFRALNFGGKAMISRAETAHGGNIIPAIEEMEGVQGAGHQATAEGQRWKAHIDRRVNQVVEGINPSTGKKLPPTLDPATGKKIPAALTQAERKRVQLELNGEEDIGGEGQYEEGAALKLRPMTPREQSAYRQLRTLTAMDWRVQQDAALAIALRKTIPDGALRNEVAQHFKSGQEPVVPEPGERVKVEYGDPVPHSRSKFAPPQEAFTEVGGQQTRSRPTIMFDQAVKDLGLNQFDKRTLAKALHDDKVFGELTDPEMQQRAAQIREAMAQQYSNRPLETTDLPEAPRFKMVPKNQAEIDHMTKVRANYMRVLGLISKQDEGGLMRYRQHYYPFRHSLGEPQGREGFSTNPSEYANPRQQQRENLKITNANDIKKDFASMSSNTAKQVETKVLNEGPIGSLLNDPDIADVFKQDHPATGKYRDDWQKAKDNIRAVTGWPRAALVGITPGHMINEMAMAFNTVPIERQPKFWYDTTALAKKIFMAQVRGDTKEYARLTAPGRALGAGVGSFDERKPFFQNFPEALPYVGGKSVPVIGWWSRGMNRLVWSTAEAIRQNYAKLLLETGEAKTPLQAGGIAEKRLVDYQYRSPLQNAMRLVAPFGTYRGGIPGAVLGGIVRDPRRAAALSRISGGAIYGDKPAKGQEGWEAYTPTAEVGRMLDYAPPPPGTRFGTYGPLDYVRGSLGIPAAALANAIQDQTPLQPAHLATYGEPWLPKRLKNGQLDLGFILQSAIGGIPAAQQILEANGIGRYQWRGILDYLQRSFTRTSYAQPLPVQTAAPLQLAPLSGGSAPGFNPLTSPLPPQ